MSHEEHYAIVVGINTYPDLGNLNAPVADAEAFYAWLRKPDGGNLQAQNIRLLRTTDFPVAEPPVADKAHPIPNEIDVLFQPLVMQGTQGRVGERIYIFMAGHGFSDPQNMDSAALYAANAQKLFPYHVAVTEYADWLRRNGVFDEIILIMDCCRDINPVHTISKPALPTTEGSPRAAEVRSFYAFAVGWNQKARETMGDDGTYSGIFTRALLKALEITRPNDHGAITGQLLKDQIHNIIHSSANTIQLEPPEIKVDSQRDIIFIKREVAGITPIQVTLEPHTGQEVLVLFDDTGELGRTVALNSTVTFPLKPGLYKVTVERSNRKKLFEVPGDEQITV